MQPAVIGGKYTTQLLIAPLPSVLPASPSVSVHIPLCSSVNFNNFNNSTQFNQIYQFIYAYFNVQTPSKMLYLFYSIPFKPMREFPYMFNGPFIYYVIVEIFQPPPHSAAIWGWTVYKPINICSLFIYI